MAKINLKSKKMWRDILVITLSCIAIVGVFFGIFALSEKLDEQTTRTIHPSYGVGGLTEDGKYLETESSIYTKEAFECQGLNVKMAFANTASYRIYFYDGDNNFIGATEILEENFDEKNVPYFAEFARIVITPDEDEKISLLEVSGYANQLTISVNKEQEEVAVLYYGENKFVNNANSTASLAGGVDGFEITQGSTGNISDLIYITDCTNICIRIHKEHLTDVMMYFHKQDTMHTATTLDKFPFEKTFDREYVYLVMDLSSAYADDVAICLTSDNFDMTGTQVYVW